MIAIALWYNNYQAPSVLMIDDLSDAYIEVHNQEYMNDWGYLRDADSSAYSFLKTQLLNKYKKIKITFFIPYERHAVINENTPYPYKKYALGERDIFSNFLKTLVKEGHELAHHGSNHGRYIDPKNLSTSKNFKHEWESFETIEEGIKVTQKGIKLFNKHINTNITGGKFCGYQQRENSLEIINSCNFLYWCDKVNFINKDYACKFFGSNNLLLFPTNFSGNSFVRLSYKTGDSSRDNKKKILKYLQPIYNIFQYKQLNHLYKNREIISIQEHISPSTTSGSIQSANIISDIKSLNKIYKYLSKKSIWYATCAEIANYFFIQQNTTIKIEKNQIIIDFNNYKNLMNSEVSLFANEPFILTQHELTYRSILNNLSQVINLPITNGKNIFNIQKDKE